MDLLKTIAIIAVLAAAVTDWLAVARGWKKIEYLAKPATMLILLGYLVLAGGLVEIPLMCFGLGILFSLAGDVFLMISFYRFSDRWFIPGLFAFMMAHLSYIAGLNIPFGSASPLWAFGLSIILALTGARIIRRIVAGVTGKGLRRMVAPVIAYGTVITLMLLSAVLTLYRVEWKFAAAGLVSLGAILFYASDTILAWNKFVTPVKNGRVLNMMTYHLGQIALVAGIVFQYGK